MTETVESTAADDPYGLYLHVPFCRHRCDYCAFATWTDRTELADRYLTACETQITTDLADGPPVTSVFVGGGTPTLVDPGRLMDVLAAVPLASGAEVTIECNPDDVSVDMFRTYAAGGVTRLSIGVQSMDPEVLRSLGRTHDPANVYRAAEAAHEVGIGFSVDLIYGAAGESVDQWARTLSEALTLEPVHVSAYALTVEAGTPLATQPNRHPDDDDQADKYLLATDMLGDAGFDWYEISNWARPRRRCRHNLLYWLGGNYLPVGCAAHGHRNGRRYWHVRTPERYVDAIEQGRSPVAAGETLEAVAHRLEALQLLIRTGAGVPQEALNRDDVTGVLAGLVEVVDAAPVDWDVPDVGRRVVLTPAGRLLANEVALRLV